MIVIDASVAVRALDRDGDARIVARSEELHAPDHIDLEIANALRRRERLKLTTPEQAASAIDTWRATRIRRHGATILLARVWQLRHNLTPYDAAYVALAELLRCPLLTMDTALAQSSAAQHVAQLITT